MILKGLATAGADHGTYNFLLFLHPVAGFGVFLLVPFLFCFLSMRIQAARRLSAFRRDEES